MVKYKHLNKRLAMPQLVLGNALASLRSTESMSDK